jgi:hypothetical protein
LKTNSAFSSENLLVSISGHLAILALLVTSFAVLNPMDNVVMSDHVQIYEIDLTKVEIKGDETLVFNTDAPSAPPAEGRLRKTVGGAEKKQDQQIYGDDQQLQNPSLVENTPKAPPSPATPDSPPSAEGANDAPRAPTVVRVNRETTSLNRTMTVSVVDALRVAMTRCWVFDRNYPGIEGLRAVAHLSMNPRGFVSDMWFEQESAAADNPGLAYIFETIRAAITNCQPFNMLPENEYERWKSIQLTFYPSSGSVQ